MSRDILGIYRGKDTGSRGPKVQAHTPDPAGYHDASQERLEGESAAGATVLHKLPGSLGFGGLRGVIIPRSTALGGSRGHDHHRPSVIHIDPGPYGEGGIRVDLSRVDPESMARAMEESSATASDMEDVALGAFAAGAGHAPPPPREQLTRDDERLPPLQMPGTYVVPKATAGGGQQVKRASFTDRQLRDRDEQIRRQQLANGPRGVSPIQPQGSLHAEFERAAPQPEPQRPADSPSVQATFEIPGGHQFHVLYHDIVRQDMTLVLVYDHSRPFQMVYFPPPIEDPDGESVGVALLVRGRGKGKDMLYRVHCPGVQFRYQGLEFCVLLIDKEKELGREET